MKSNKKMFFILVVILLTITIFSTNAFSEEEGFTWGGWRTIEQLYPRDNGFIFVLSGYPVSTVITDLYCQSRFYLSKDAENYQTKVSTLQLVYGLQDEIQVHYDEAGIEPRDGYIRFDRFQTRKVNLE